MIKLFSIFGANPARLGMETGAFAARCATLCETWLHDPLAHPELDRMSPTELADLPAMELRARGRG